MKNVFPFDSIDHIPLSPFVTPHNPRPQGLQINSIQGPHIHRLQRHIRPVSCHNSILSLCRNTVEDAQRRTVDVAKHCHATGLAVSRAIVFATVPVFKSFASAVDYDLRFLGVSSYVGVLNVVIIIAMLARVTVDSKHKLRLGCGECEGGYSAHVS